MCDTRNIMRHAFLSAKHNVKHGFWCYPCSVTCVNHRVLQISVIVWHVKSPYSECLAVDHMKTHTETDGWESDGETRSDGNQENNSVETEEDNMEIDRVNGGAENKGSEGNQRWKSRE